MRASISADSLNRLQESPLVDMRLEEFIQEYAVALISGAFLEWQSYQIPKAAFRQCVLAREETIIRIQSNLMAAFHGPGQQRTTKLPGIGSEHWAVDEKPDVRTFS
jgi:hypothetical protein